MILGLGFVCGLRGAPATDLLDEHAPGLSLMFEDRQGLIDGCGVSLHVGIHQPIVDEVVQRCHLLT